ncbi:MAG TPA: GNAT family N-acetyltransferase [Candidatus Nitrosotenuis sp.]|jgi:ribosomal protein S18 acetylase RimI-like enzyme|nr:GNAT family N-acetyltransferase [Candidatus Nitrosotenuis sp.]
MSLTIHQTQLTEELKKHIFDGFRDHALLKTGIDGREAPVSFVAYNGIDFAGAVVVEVFWGQLHIKYVYVEEKFRGQEIATNLLSRALLFGKERGCQFAFVETMNFQALEFYQNLGFVLEFTRSGFAQGTSFHYLMKDLSEEAPRFEPVDIRLLTADDIAGIVQAYAAYGKKRPAKIFENYLKEQNQNKRLVWLAFDGETFAGLVTLKWQSKYKSFRDQQIPEIKDFNVLPPFRQKGIGSALLETAERAARERSPIVGLCVGLYHDYGDAQQLYVKRNYIPDGFGITYNYRYIKPGDKFDPEDALSLWFTKKLI